MDALAAAGGKAVELVFERSAMAPAAPASGGQADERRAEGGCGAEWLLSASC